ncbi:hypothetical protein AXG93_1356s1270 [Marchantia polymorpha subsp. ruderalis]|uniref:Uncharacterized protein n=1 Tax=Marchantia polymorpha subsp. ruderalis TaxID=1480154 RepID=A0A176WSV1_MARPO|nr:hypothetical protein AXG93_1356s1270 [Marchantia polymorpha subsp. ruderalis]
MDLTFAKAGSCRSCKTRGISPDAKSMAWREGRREGGRERFPWRVEEASQRPESGSGAKVPMVSEGRVAGLGTAFAVRAPDSASSETLLDEDMGRIGSNDTSTVPGKSPIGKLLTYFHMVFDQINFRWFGLTKTTVIASFEAEEGLGGSL